MNAMTITEMKPMATETETSYRSYYVVKPADLMPGPVAEVMFGLIPGRNEQDGPLAEMAFRWYDYSGRTHCRLEIFGESWGAFSRMPDVIAVLGTMIAEQDPSKPWLTPASLTVETIVEKLELLGFIELGVREARA